MAEFASESEYLESTTTTESRLQAMDRILLALDSAFLQLAQNADVQEYTLNDGQTIIRTQLRSAAQVEQMYAAIEIQRQRLINRLNGRCSRLSNVRTIRRNYNGYY